MKRLIYLSILTLSLIAFSTGLKADAWVLTNGEKITLKTATKGYLCIYEDPEWMPGDDPRLQGLMPKMDPDIFKWKVIKVKNNPQDASVYYQDRFYLYSEDFKRYLCRRNGGNDFTTTDNINNNQQKQFVFINPTDPGSGACVALEPKKSLRVRFSLDVGGNLADIGDLGPISGTASTTLNLGQDCIWVIEK